VKIPRKEDVVCGREQVQTKTKSTTTFFSEIYDRWKVPGLFMGLFNGKIYTV